MTVKKILIATAAVLLVTVAHVDAKTRRHVVRQAASSGVTVYDHDSRDPNVGWHNDSSGMRVCSYDCDNPEIPGSGARCRSVNFGGMAMRECVTGTSLFGGPPEF
jgi:hypothetical protein